MMGVFFIYSLKTALCLIAFYLLYKVALSRETFHSLNRAALLGLMALSLVLPLVHVTSGFEPIGGGGMAQIEGLIKARVVEDAGSADAITPTQVLFAIYIIGVVFFTGRELWSLASLLRIIRRGRHLDAGDGARLIVVEGDISPFSWFGNVIIGEKDYEENPREIIIHEKAHIARRHSTDVLLCDLFIIFQWFNPAAWLVKAELQNVHEYEADNDVLSCGVDATSYQLLLIRKAVGDRLFSMANNLNHSSLKKRIKMMLKKKSNPWSRAKVLLAVPMAAVAVAAFAIPAVEDTADEMRAESDKLVTSLVKEAKAAPSEKAAPVAEPVKEAAPVPVAAPKQEAEVDPADVTPVPDGDKTYDTVETQPKFPGGYGELAKYLGANIKYPEAAIKAGTEGVVIVNFTICKDGSICDAAVVRSVSTELDAEALRLVSNMPKWEPGKIKNEPVNVKFTLPVNFKIQ